MTRLALAAVVLVGLRAAPAAADPVPPGAIGAVWGAVSGTGADAKRLGFGYYQLGLQASWQPTPTERRWGWTVRWATMFGTLYDGNAATIDTALRTVQMDLMLGVRVRPWASQSRFLTFRGGGELLRTNQPLMGDQRAFVGAIGSVGVDQYVGGFLFNVDVRYGLIGTGPDEVALLVGIALAGP